MSPHPMALHHSRSRRGLFKRSVEKSPLRLSPLGLILLQLSATDLEAAMKMEKTSYGGWKNCVRLKNEEIELVATTDVGPRVIRLGFIGGPNLFKEWKDQLGKTGGDGWNIFGGHRLWHAPEQQPRTYAPDNAAVESKWDGRALRLIQQVEATTGIQKEIELALDGGENHVTVRHRLTNRNQWDVELSPWALSVMQAPGRVILPQEPYIAHSEKLLPARPLVLWGYTDMKDPRWLWGTKYIQLKGDPKREIAQKIGLMNTPGWAAFVSSGGLFLKRFGFEAGATYPDFGSNTETYTNGDMLEVETLGPLTRLAPGASVDHVEHWFLHKVDVGEDEASIDQVLLPLVKQTDKYKP